MSLQFVDKVRFELNEIDSMFNSIGLNKSSNVSTSASSSTPVNQGTVPKKTNDDKIKLNSQTLATAPKTPSNLVKSTIPSFSTSTSLQMNSDVMLYDRKQLMDFLGERQDNLLKTRSEYEIQFENFFSLAKKFNVEKLNNLKLTFKNQILKQQIYFETELLDLCKECNRDYECANKSKLNSKTRRLQTNHSKLDQEKHLIRQFKTDMKKLLDYMREALINSSDTLIEAYETCQTLKGLEHAENNFQKQNNQMKSTTSVLMKSLERANLIQRSSESDNDEESSDLDKQLNEEQIQFNKYKQEMDELMHTLDDIELQHLQRKDQLSSKTKFCNKLKSKFKYIETKYEVLNKQITNLKHENYVYKELWHEKKRSNFKSLASSFNDSCSLLPASSNQKQIDNENSYCEFNSCSKSSAVSSLSPTSLSKSSSTSSLSDCVADLISSSNDTNSNHTEEASSSSSTTSSSSSSLCNHDLSELMSGSAHLDDENNDDSNEYDLNKDDNRSYLSLTDYNRKLSLINELINLHKSKMSTKDLWSMSSTTSTSQSSATNFIKANIKCFNLKEEESNLTFHKTDLFDEKLTNYTIFETNGNEKFISINNNELNNCRLKQASSLDLTDCSTDGDRVIVENCNLKSDRDISNWYITRQIENMSISKYKLPIGSVIKSGKVLKIETPFANDQLDYLIAIKNQYKIEEQTLRSSAKFQIKKLCLKIRTKLISPDGTLKAIHIQEIPQFYQDIFKYANMIHFL